MSAKDANLSTKSAPELNDPQSAGVTRKASSFLPLLTMLIALSALLIAGWSAWQVQAVRTLPALVSNDLQRLTGLSQRLEELASASSQQAQLIDDLASSLDSGLAVVPELSLRVQQNERQILSIPGVNARGKSAWLITEAIYYLQIANAQLALAANVDVAASALRLADEKLRDAGDPRMVAVRAQLSAELTALEAVPVIDRTGMSFRLQSLAVQADQWPFRRTAPDSFSPAIDLADAEAELTAWQRVVATLKAVFNSIVSIKETDAPRAEQLGSAEQALIVEVVKAELQVSRLALIAGNADLFTQSLERVDSQLSGYFDIEAAAVVAARTTVDELLAIELPDALPDVSGSLSLLLSLQQPAAGTPGKQP